MKQKCVKARNSFNPKTVLLFLGAGFIILLNGCNHIEDFGSPKEQAEITTPLAKPTARLREKEAVTSTPIAEDDSNLILINKSHPINEKYQVKLMELTYGQYVAVSIYPSLQKMFDDARREGIYPEVVAGYRTSEMQQQLLDEKIKEYCNVGYSKEDARKEAVKWVAVPGTSEHQLGLAVDINAEDGRSDGKEVYDWLSQNSYKYGFILRYPADKTDITGISNEPWHYRYVGKKAAAEIYKQGICLEEYLGEVDS